MGSIAIRCVAGSLALLLAGAGRAEDGRPKRSPLTPEQEAELIRYPQIGKIPRSLWNNFEGLDEFIKTSDDDRIRNNYRDRDFRRALAILAGIGRERTEETRRPGPGRPPADPAQARSRGEEDYYRGLGRSLGDQSWPFDASAQAAYRRGDFRAAMRDYEAAIRVDPEDSTALLGFGHSANELGDYALASMAAKQVLAREPGNSDALGLYHFANGRAPAVHLPSSIFQTADGSRGEAQQTLERSIVDARARGAAPPPGSAPGSVERSASITRDAAAALRMKDFPGAHRLASQAIELNAANAQALNFRAIASNRMHRYSDAVADASAALALAPGSAPALQTRSWSFAQQGDYEKALKDAQETLSLDPANPFAYQNKALALAGLKDRTGALEALRRSAALDPRFQNRLERALQLPQDQDLTMLFDDESAAAAPAPATAPVRAPAGKRFARLAVLSTVGGILIALAILNVASAGWREKVQTTIRRALAPSGATAAGDAPAPSSPGAAFWLQYELIKEIGLGGMGVVYEAQDRSLERRVAVKKMRDEIKIDPRERRRFINEAKLVAQLRHPNIVDIYAIVEEGPEVYLVFEFVSGRTLHDRIRSDGALSLEEARGVLRAAASAVEHAHAAQIVHRDLKPSNIMITDDGRIKVMDFGVARQAKDAITKMSMTNTVVGTPPYMAPEQEQGTVRRESDVYALGVCLYEMLTGQLPFSGGGAAMLLNKLNGKHIPPSQRNPGLPAALDAVIARALIPDPDKRYRTPTELAAALDAVLVKTG